MSLPVNIELMNVDAFINQHDCKQVTTMFIKEPTSNEFHKKGLFSEDIFGQIGSPERLIKFGYIELNTTIFHPIIYTNLIRLKALYGQIISGKDYARFDPTISDFVLCSMNEPGAGTGFKFFVDNWERIKFKKNASVTQNDKVNLVEKYKNIATIARCLVMPAGLRDMSIDDGKPASDSINKLYASLINYTHAMPSIGSESDIFDGVRFAIQKKVNEIYEFIFEMIEGKFGFFQRKYGSRNLALGTRNVITPADMSASSTDDPTYFKVDEVKLPLFEAAKMFQPLVIYNMKQLFLNDVFSQFSDKVALIDPKTYSLVYQPITEEEKTKFLSTEGLEKLLSLFRDKEFRFNPVTVYNEEEVPYYLYMVYDTGDVIRPVRSVSSLINSLQQSRSLFNPNKLRPMTYAELVYLSTFRATVDKCATVTRYPAIEIGSDVPCKVHLMSSNPARTVTILLEDNISSFICPEYPIIGNSFNDSAVLHPSILKGLGADFDGNCVVGSTTTKIKYTDQWLDTISHADYSASKQNIQEIVCILKEKTYHKSNGLNYAEIRMDEFPQPGNYTLDKNGAKVYTIPSGCSVESFVNSKCVSSYEPIEHLTVEDKCETARVNLRSKSIQVSTNESVAVFDRKTGNIIRIKPEECSNTTYVPVYVKSDTPFGSYGTFEDGWLLGSLLSDGWISDRYVGYAKNNGSTREMVKTLLIERTGCDHISTDIVDTEQMMQKYGKYGFSIRLKFAGEKVCSYVRSLDMYEQEPYNFYTKRIPPSAFRNGSEKYLWGILSGLIEGDGSYIIVDNGFKNKIDARFTTSSPFLRDTIKHLCYRLGIRITITTTPVRPGTKYESFNIVFSSVDICRLASNLKFASSKYSTVNQYVCDFLYEPKRDQRDVIPITHEEGRILRSVINISSADTAFYTPVVMRSVVMNLLPRLDPDLSLVKRALNTNVHWEPVRSVEQCGVEQVFDFDIPTTRLYVVNDGIVTYDTVSINGILTKEANEEVRKYLDSVERFVHPNGSLFAKHTDLINLTVFNLSREPAK